MPFAQAATLSLAYPYHNEPYKRAHVLADAYRFKPFRESQANGRPPGCRNVDRNVGERA
jgi:hypothetical protein